LFFFFFFLKFGGLFLPRTATDERTHAHHTHLASIYNA
jgi:hypothetical protein